MSILSSRAATWIVLTWLVVVGLIGLLAAPWTSATNTLLIIIAGLVVPAIALSLSKKPSAVLAEVRRHASRVAKIRIVLVLFIVWVAVSSSVVAAQDFSKYRDFRLGMSVDEVAQLAGIAPDAGVTHQRPELIQELVWELQAASGHGSSPRGDSLRKVLFSFYNGQLFRLVVSYDWDSTEGLTVGDMVEALSVVYGPPLLPATDITASLSRVRTDGDRIVAQWGDARYSVNLFRPSYASTFGLAVFEKRLDALARAANVEPIRLDQQRAQRAIERRKEQKDEDLAREEKVRQVNKASFRPER
jgi:hypothetical protein